MLSIDVCKLIFSKTAHRAHLFMSQKQLHNWSMMPGNLISVDVCVT
jgi:hypothetical protein